MNSANQWWSSWTWTVKPEYFTRSFEEVKTNCARFGRKAFGSSARMRVTKLKTGFITVEVLAEGQPVTDAKWREYMHQNWTTFFRSGFGSARVWLKTKLMSGSPQDGKPAEQMLILPRLDFSEVLSGQ